MDHPINPPLKWAGGKRWLLPVLRHFWQANSDKRLVEPFVGGMAVALGLRPKQALLNDANSHLINFYRQLQLGLQVSESFINDKDHFYAARSRFNQLIEQRGCQSEEGAQLFYYLLRTGFNGLCRFNKKGFFNVPFGRYATVAYRDDFSDYQQALANWQIKCADFQALEVRADDFLYVDPPYDVQFTTYHSVDFLWEDQVRLASWLAEMPNKILISNQATPRIIELYQRLGFKILTLSAPRFISSNGNRDRALEVVATLNFSNMELQSVFDKIKAQDDLQKMDATLLAPIKTVA